LIDDLSTFDVDRHDSARQIPGDEHSPFVLRQGDAAREVSSRESAHDRTRGRIDFDHLPGIFEGRVDFRPVARRHDAVRLVEYGNRLHDLARIGIKDRKRVVGVCRRGQSMRRSQERHPFGLVADGNLVDDLVRRQIDDADSAVVAIGRRQQGAVRGNVDEAVRAARVHCDSRREQHHGKEHNPQNDRHRGLPPLT
jgi:hypothetical protein